MIRKSVPGLLLIVALAATGCADKQAVELKPPLVKTQLAVPAEKATETYSGQIKGRRVANLSFQVGGEIISREAEVGSRVRAGDVLMRISPRDVRQKLTQAQAQIVSAGAQLDLAQTNLARYEELFAVDAVPEATLDQYRTTYRAAASNYDSAVAAANEAQNALGYTELVAPADGIVTQINAEVGQVAAAGYTVLTLMQTDETEAEVFLPENRLPLAPVGTAVRVNFWANGAEVSGVVREVSPMADAARTYRLRITLADVPAGIEAGMTANVVFTNNQSAAAGFILPLSAIYQTADTPQVWLVQNGQIAAQPVEILAYRGDNVVVTGIDAKARVVIGGVNKLRDGQKVREENTTEVAAP